MTVPAIADRLFRTSGLALHFNQGPCTTSVATRDTRRQASSSSPPAASRLRNLKTCDDVSDGLRPLYTVVRGSLTDQNNKGLWQLKQAGPIGLLNSPA